MTSYWVTFNLTEVIVRKGVYSLSNYPILAPGLNVYGYYLEITPTVSPVLEVCGDQNLGLYLTHKSNYKLPNMCNWKSYKTPFHRLAHVSTG